MLKNASLSVRAVVSARSIVRNLSDSTQTNSGCVFVDSVFPIQIGKFDLRRYIGLFREDFLLQSVRSRLSSVKVHNFAIDSVQRHPKDGGVFVKFTYSASDEQDALTTIEQELRQTLATKGALPSWLGTHAGNIWLVKGRPWIEDMDRYPSPILKIAFEGPDVHEETLYETLRPYGRIKELSPPNPAPAGLPRFSTVIFHRTRSAAIARNVLHGFTMPSDSDRVTRLRTIYEAPIQGHAMRDWLSNHPKIVLPIVFTLLATITYTIFDPIRSLMIQGKVEEWFDLHENKVYQWLRTNTVDRFYGHAEASPSPDSWKERKDAEDAIKTYINDLPTTIAFLHGPQGTGKTTMLQAVLRNVDRKTLVIDCRPLLKTTSDTQLVSALAAQTGYWPIFSFFNSFSHMIDLASVGIIGQKAGFSSSLADQLQSILSITTDALKKVSSSHRRAVRRHMEEMEKQQMHELQQDHLKERIRNGTWHDPRLDVIAGNGVMSELGFGDEKLGENDSLQLPSRENLGQRDEWHRQKTAEDIEAVESLPIVIIRNYESRGGSSKIELMGEIARWAAALAENQVAHVIVVSDSRENMKNLAKALPAKPLNMIALDDADSTSALAFVRQKLRDADISLNFNKEQTHLIERLGGRASDLESLIHKIRSGLEVEEAVEDIISRGVGEIQKNAFGDDPEDAKNLPWTREQVWIVLKKLSSQPEISFSEVLLDFPFKGDETPLRNMEHAELISMGTHNGRPTTIRPGKPVYRYVFQRLAQDPLFQAFQDLTFNEKAITSSENTVKTCEEELTKLKDMGADTGFWATLGLSSVLSQRAKYLLDKIRVAQTKIEKFERQNAGLKKVLANVPTNTR